MPGSPRLPAHLFHCSHKKITASAEAGSGIGAKCPYSRKLFLILAQGFNQDPSARARMLHTDVKMPNIASVQFTMSFLLSLVDILYHEFLIKNPFKVSSVMLRVWIMVIPAPSRASRTKLSRCFRSARSWVLSSSSRTPISFIL